MISLANKRRDTLQLQHQVNITPFVDVMLVLLVIFMMTSSIIISGLNVDLPETEYSAMKNLQDPVEITIDASGVIYLSAKKTEIGDLLPKLSKALKRKNRKILIRGDKNVDYGSIMNVFSIIKQAGYSDVGLVTQLRAINEK